MIDKSAKYSAPGKGSDNLGFIPYLGDIISHSSSICLSDVNIDLITKLNNELFLISVMDLNSNESLIDISTKLLNSIKLLEETDKLAKLKNDLKVGSSKITPAILLPLFSNAADQFFYNFSRKEPSAVIRIWEVLDQSQTERLINEPDNDPYTKDTISDIYEPDNDTETETTISDINEFFCSIGMSELAVVIFYPTDNIKYNLWEQKARPRIDCYKYRTSPMPDVKHIIAYDEESPEYLVSKPIYCNDLSDLKQQLSDLRIASIHLFELVLDYENLDEDGDPNTLREGNITENPIHFSDLTQEQFDWLVCEDDSNSRNIKVAEYVEDGNKSI